LSHWENKEKLREMLKKAGAELSGFDVLPYTADIARKQPKYWPTCLKETSL